jgi:hypothetical protein
MNWQLKESFTTFLSLKIEDLQCLQQMELALYIYVNSDFASMWHKEHAHLRDSIFSQTGLAILFGGCPIIWSSKLQNCTIKN